MAMPLRWPLFMPVPTLAHIRNYYWVKFPCQREMAVSFLALRLIMNF